MSVLNRTYYASSGLVAVSGTSAVPALYVSTPATADLVICKILVAIESTSAQSASPSTNNSILFTLNTVTGSVAGGAAVTPHQQPGASSLAARSTWTSGSTALTGLTQSTDWWGQPIALSAGSWAAQDETNTGLEIAVPISSTLCFYYLAASGAGSNLAAKIEAWFTE